MSKYRTSDLASAALPTEPAVFSYTPTGRAIPASTPMRTPAPRLIAPSCTPSGRIVFAAPGISGAA